MKTLHKTITKEDIERIMWIAKAFNTYHSKGVDTVTAYGFAEALYEERSEYDPVEAVLEDLTYWSE